jgi:signal transduction histidine kinase
MRRFLAGLATLGFRAAPRPLFRNSVLSGVAVLAGTLVVWQSLVARDRRQLANATDLAASAIADKLSSEILSRTMPVRRLAVRWGLHVRPVREQWMSEAELFATAMPGYLAIAWVDSDLQPQWFAPQAGNAALAAPQWTEQPRSRDAFERARESRALAASRSIELAGERAFLVCMPVVSDGVLRGFIAGLFRTDELLNDILTAASPSAFATAVYDGDRQLYPRRARGTVSQPLSERKVDIHGIPWQVRVSPRAASLLDARSRLPQFVLIAGIGLALLVGVAVRLAETRQVRARALERLNRKLEREIAERHRVAEELRRANEALHSVIETCPLAILGIDARRLVTIWNSAASSTLGWGSGEVMGRPAPVLSDRVPAVAPGVERLVRLDCLLPVKNGGEIQAQVWGAILCSRNGSFAGMIWLIADQTEHKRLEDRLRRSEKFEAVSRLAGGLAHDFNNILGVIIGYAERVRDRIEPEGPLAAQLEQILAAAERAAAITDQLLAFGRGQTIRPELIDVNRFACELRPTLQKLVGDNVDIVIPAARTMGKVRIDPAQLQQVINTLALNAREAMPEGGRLSIETHDVVLGCEYAERLEVPAGAYVVLSITDTGSGVDDDTLQHLFEPFFTTRPLGRGIGLGLSTVHGIATQNGGGVEVNSNPGRGTVFRIYLPVA